ncbi:MAG: hypothetical protein ACON5F_13420 [Jejuia sp.]
MLKPLNLLLLFLVLSACKTEPQDNAETTEVETIETETTTVISETDIAKLNYIEFDLDSKVEAIVEVWEPYFELSTAIGNFKKADFSFYEKDEKAVSELIKNMRKTIPDTLDTQGILSRITIVESMLYKLKESYNVPNATKEEVGETLKELFVSYSNLNFQLNKKLEKDSQRIDRP